jgi:cystathionine gamma-synthase
MHHDHWDDGTDAPDPRWSPDTLAVAAGRPERVPGAAVGPPVELSSTFVGAGKVPTGQPMYGRVDNATWTACEEALGALEGAPGGTTLFASGMAAIAAVLDLVPDGGLLVVPDAAYNTTLELAEVLHGRGRLRVARVDVADTAAVLATLDGDDRPDLLWLESPTNPLLQVSDLATCLPAAHSAGVLTVVDNTFATPLVQRPLDLGADLVVHSVTKYLAGHSDVVLGAAATRDATLSQRLRTHRRLHGAVPGPFEAWLALRGMRTLALRVARAQASAADLAARLAAHPAVARVRHPSLPDDPGHALASAQMRGFGAVLTVQVHGGPDAADAFVDAVRLWVPATSLGGVESMLERRRRHANEPQTVPEDLVRLSVGIEDVEDLWADLDQALRASS